MMRPEFSVHQCLHQPKANPGLAGQLVTQGQDGKTHIDKTREYEKRPVFPVFLQRRARDSNPQPVSRHHISSCTVRSSINVHCAQGRISCRDSAMASFHQRPLLPPTSAGLATKWLQRDGDAAESCLAKARLLGIASDLRPWRRKVASSNSSARQGLAARAMNRGASGGATPVAALCRESTSKPIWPSLHTG